MKDRSGRPLSMLAISLVFLICSGLLYFFKSSERESKASLPVTTPGANDGSIQNALDDLRMGKVFSYDLTVSPHDSRQAIERGLAVVREAWRSQCDYVRRYGIASTIAGQELCPNYDDVSKGKLPFEIYEALTPRSVSLCQRILVSWQSAPEMPKAKVSGTDDDLAVMYCRARSWQKLPSDAGPQTIP